MAGSPPQSGPLSGLPVPFQAQPLQELQQQPLPMLRSRPCRVAARWCC